MRLIDAPVGLFMYEETLCLKTEYMNRQGGVEAYIVESGDVFWGGAKSQEERNNLDVTPVSLDDLKQHGRWEECDWVRYDGHSECVHFPRAGLVCTNCRNAFKKELLWKDNYCPNCGAKMDLKE